MAFSGAVLGVGKSGGQVERTRWLGGAPWRGFDPWYRDARLGPHPIRLALLGLVLAVALACGGGGGSSANPVPPAATADFTLSLSPASVQIPSGGSAFVTVTLSRLNGFASPVTLTGVGFPSGVVAAGTLASDASSIQLPIAVAPGVAATAYSGLSIRGQLGALIHDAAFGLAVSPALSAGVVRDDLVQAPGGRQAGGTIENQAVVRELVRSQTIKDANDTIRVRQGFLPSGSPTDH